MTAQGAQRAYISYCLAQFERCRDQPGLELDAQHFAVQAMKTICDLRASGEAVTIGPDDSLPFTDDLKDGEMHELKEGVKLERIRGPVSTEGYMRLGDEPQHCKEMVVVMQPGQMGMVPWARCETNSGFVVLVNLALMESVTLA